MHGRNVQTIQETMSSDSFGVSDFSSGEAAPQTPPNRENINNCGMTMTSTTAPPANRLSGSPPQGPLQQEGNGSDNVCVFHADFSDRNTIRQNIGEEEQGRVPTTATASSAFYSSHVNSPLLDFPIMTTHNDSIGSNTGTSHSVNTDDGLPSVAGVQESASQNHTWNNSLADTFGRNSNTAESVSTSIATSTDSTNSVANTIRWNSMSLNRETIRYNTRRRRASSFDELPPVPRVSLRPRFTRHLDRSLVPSTSRSSLSTSSQHQPNVSNCTCMECIMNSLSSESQEDGTTNPNSSRLSTNNNLTGFLHIDHEVTTRPIPLRIVHPHPTRHRHFRNHTYGGSDASTDIFSLAMELEQSTADQRGLSNNSDLASSSNQEATATVPIVHPNPFELSSLNQNLPPAVQTFMAPCNPVPSTNTNSSSANITRPIPRHRKHLGLGETSFLTSIHSSLPRTRPPSITINANQYTNVTTNPTMMGTANITNNASPSLGTPTCTCTLSTSSVSAFDQTYSPQWQDHTTSPGGSIFQGLKDHSSVHSSTSSVKRGRDDDNVECTETNANAKRISHDNAGQHKSTLPFDEVHLLIDHTTGDDKSNGKAAPSSEEDCHGKQP